jgi:hypothetical protein
VSKNCHLKHLQVLEKIINASHGACLEAKKSDKNWLIIRQSKDGREFDFCLHYSISALVLGSLAFFSKHMSRTQAQELIRSSQRNRDN